MPPGTKSRLHKLLQDTALGRPPSDVWHTDATFRACHPWGTLKGLSEIATFWSALRTSLPDMERRDLIFVGGANQDDERLTDRRAPHLVAAMGHYQGNFVADLLDIPATHGVVDLRYGEAHFLDGNKIRASWVWIDLLDLARQCGVELLPAGFGSQGTWPGPATQDGLRLADTQEDDLNALGIVLDMHQALLSFDGRSLDSMPHEMHWTPHFMYYAAGGVGTTRGLSSFRAHHQIPFLRAFPDRRGEGHFIRISDGPFAVTGGNVIATHKGPYLGMTPTGRPVRIPVMDFYRLDGARIAENWLPMDVLGIAHQMGHDLLARLRHYRGRPDLTL